MSSTRDQEGRGKGETGSELRECGSESQRESRSGGDTKPIELYRHGAMIELRSPDWGMALQIVREMGWAPKRPLEAYAEPLWLVTHDEAQGMHRAGKDLFDLIKREPTLSVSIPMDLGVLYRIIQFVAGGAFIVGKKGAYEEARANGDLE